MQALTRELWKCQECGAAIAALGEHVCQVPNRPEPHVTTLARWAAQGVAQATDGCHVEARKGMCAHGKRSWLCVLGYC